MSRPYYYEASMKCHECKGTDIFTDTSAGEVICRECGVVLGERLIDDGAEWRTFNNDDTLYGNRSDPNRCGGAASPLDSGESGMATFISGGNDKKEMRVLQKVQGVAMKMSRSEKNLQERYKDLEEYASRLGLTRETKECACLILQQLNAKGKFNEKSGNSGTRVALAALYHATKERGGSWDLKSFCQIFKDIVNKQNFTKAKRYVEKHLDGIAGKATTTVRGADLVPRIGNELMLRANVILAAKDVAKAATDISLVDGMRPRGVAGASILLACSACAGGKWRQRGSEEGKMDVLGLDVVATAAGIGAPTVLKVYKLLYAARESLLTEAFLASVMPRTGKGEGSGKGGKGVREENRRSAVDDIPFVA